MILGARATVNPAAGGILGGLPQKGRDDLEAAERQEEV